MKSFIVAFLFMHCALAAAAQQPVPRTREDSLRARAAADSAALADSLAIVRELEGAAAAAPPAGTSANPRLLPDISAVGDLIGDLSPDASTQEDASRFSVREVEIAVQAAVDPYFRGDVYLAFNDEEGAAVEQAYLTTSALPWSLQVRLGRFLLPLGKQNTTHRHDLHTIEFPHVLQRFLGHEGLKGTGLEVSRIGAPLGFYQELILTAVNDLGGHHHGHEHEELVVEEPANQELAGLGYSARLRNYWDLSQHTNLELSFSAATSRVPVAIGAEVDGITAVNARRTLVGSDVTLRWRPLQQGLYRSFLLQAELLYQLNERDPALPDPAPTALLAPQRDYGGAYLFARWQLSRRGFLGARADWFQDPDASVEAGARRELAAASLYYQFYPSEFSKLNAGFERLMPEDGEAVNRFLVQATFALGPHKPHPF